MMEAVEVAMLAMVEMVRVVVVAGVVLTDHVKDAAKRAVTVTKITFAGT